MIARGVSLWSIRLAWLASLPATMAVGLDINDWTTTGSPDPRLSSVLVGSVAVLTGISSMFDRARHRRRLGQPKFVMPKT